MSINSKLESIREHINEAYSVVSRKNGTVPENKNLENLADAIDSIQTGGGEVVPADVKLFAPSLSFGTFTETNNPLIITNSQNGSFVQNYDIYSSDTLLVTIAANATSNTINLRNYFSTDGHYTIRVIAKSSLMQSSDAASISYTYGTYITVNKTITNGTITDDATETTIIGGSYHATITPDTGYSFVGANVSVIMDGVDVTSTAYNGKYDISITRIEGDITINVTFAVKTRIATPEISLNGDILTITPVAHAESYMLRFNGSDFFDVENVLTGDLSELFVVDGIYPLSVVAIAEDGYYDSYDSDSVVYTVNDGETPDAVLENNSWAVIRIVSMLGDAANYWSLGDTKIDVGEDGTTRTFRIVDMQGLYNKHVVFMQVELEAENYRISPYQGSIVIFYKTSEMRTTTLPAIMAKYSNELQGSLTNTTYSIGVGRTMQQLTDKIFLPAEKEVTTTQNNKYQSGMQYKGNETEFANLITFQYFSNLTYWPQAERVKLQSNVAAEWWLRTREYSLSDEWMCITANGAVWKAYDSHIYKGVAPCFSF